MSSYKTFEEFKERAGYDVQGSWYPRVTSILSIKAKEALYRYYASLPSWGAAEAIKNRSADEGTLVHSIVEAILKKEHMPIPESIRPSIDAFLEFSRNNDIVPLKIEERIVSRTHRYAGTIDVLAEVNGTVGVLDIKTSQAVYRDYGLQTAAYIQALREDTNIPPLTSWVLRLDQAQKCLQCGAARRVKGGKEKIRGATWGCPHQWSEVQGEYELKELPHFNENIKAFLAAKDLWEWEHRPFLDKLTT